MTWVLRLCWKEYREQQWVFLIIALMTWVLVWASITALGPANLESMSSDPILRSGLTILVLVMTIAHAAVCGGMLFAGDKENRTQPFMDMLPVSKQAIWLTKMLFGLAVVVGQTLLLFGIAAYYHLGFSFTMPWYGYLLFLGYLAVAAYAWACLMANYSPTVLHAVGWSMLLFPSSWLVGPIIEASPTFGPVFCFLMPLGLLTIARLQYCRTAGKSRVQRVQSRATKFGQLRSLLWLCQRQGGALVWGSILACAVAGALWPSAGFLYWPLVTALVGILMGTMVFGGEQTWGTERFFGEQRFPRWTVWVTKVAFWLLISLAALLTLGMAGVTTYALTADPNDSGRTLITQAMSQFIDPVYFLSLGFLYGFTFGLIFTQILQKPIVAVVVSLVVTFLALLAWWPSLTCGGVPWWQVYALPVVLVAASYLLYRPWIGGWLFARRPALGIVAVFAGLMLWVAGCLWYRSVEIPDIGVTFDEREYLASLPSDNPAREPIRDALADMEKQETAVVEELWGKAFMGGPGGAAQPDAGDRKEDPFEKDFHTQLSELLDEAKPLTPKAAKALDKIFSEPWREELDKAVRLPVGVLVKSFWRVGGSDQLLQTCREASVLLNAQAMQLAKQGKTDESWECLQTAFLLTRHVYAHSGWVGHTVASVCERATLNVANTLLPKFQDDPDKLRQMQTFLIEQEKSHPPLTDLVKSAHRDWEDLFLEHYAFGETNITPEHRMLKYAHLTPWEKERDRRITNLLFASLMWSAEQPLWGISGNPFEEIVVFHNTDKIEFRKTLDDDNPAAVLSPSHWHRLARETTGKWIYYPSLLRLVKLEQENLRLLRILQIRGAQSRYEQDKGQPPHQIADLVSHYLAKIPVNPYSGAPMTLDQLQWQENPQVNGQE